MPEILFYGAPAFVGRVETLKIVHFWCDDPNNTPLDQTKLTQIDLAKALDPTNWATAELDAPYIDGGLTGIGPDFPLGRFQGALYCVEAKWTECMAKGTWRLPPGDETYQYQCLARSAANDKIERFHGFRAAVVDTVDRLALLDIYQANDPVTPPKRRWVDLQDGASCLPRGAYTTIEPIIGTSGAIFLSSTLIIESGPFIPKLPPGYGSGVWPTV